MKEYKSTVFLPKTDFSMKAGLPKKEPEILDLWKKLDIYDTLRVRRKKQDKFILHDGPPYANGNLHIGHALNKILKDVINRSQSMLGKNANYVPGWDCHGLPIEWKIEENYRKKKKNKDEVPIVEFRAECREFASKWMKIQSDEFQRLGVCGDWKNPYSTMKKEAEASIMQEIGKFLLNGSLYRGIKPVMWSPVEKTALAEAEIEYHDHISTTIYVKFFVKKTNLRIPIENTSIVIWTTTPWTIPGNKAVAYNKTINYSLITLKKVSKNSLARENEKIIISTELIQPFILENKIEDYSVDMNFEGNDFKNTILHHPLFKFGYDYDVPMLEADFVTVEQGTGFVHIAPGHGADDFELGIQNNIAINDTVKDDGFLIDSLPIFGGLHVLRDNEKIAELLTLKGSLIGKGKLNHSYPHSWRSKAPLIFRTTPQWFISMEKNNLRKLAIKSIKETMFYPKQGSNRLSSMIKARPDWCISRQRAWGVPIGIFFHKDTLEPLRDKKVISRVVNAFRKYGSDVWYLKPKSYFLGKFHDDKYYEKVTDIVDVWFDSGSTHSYVLENRKDLSWPASMYLEGTDQHRGWFHSSLLESCGTRGKAPFETVLTHGFVLDEQGRKMSKSLGNVLSPKQVLDEFGADILRLWVIGSDYYDDLRIGKEILIRHVDHYRRFRNTLRYLLGSLNDFTSDEKIDYIKMPELEKWILNRLYDIYIKIKKYTKEFKLHEIYKLIYNFCNNDLSAFYFDIRKDTLYCSSYSSLERQSCRTVMDILFKSISTWLAPILCFTSEEAWQHRPENRNKSIHLEEYFEPNKNWKNVQLNSKWNEIINLRTKVNNLIEEKRKQNFLGSSLEADVKIHLNKSKYELFKNINFSEIFICSNVDMISENNVDENIFEVKLDKAIGHKCARCWKINKLVTNNLCIRCTNVLKENEKNLPDKNI